MLIAVLKEQGAILVHSPPYPFGATNRSPLTKVLMSVNNKSANTTQLKQQKQHQQQK